MKTVVSFKNNLTKTYSNWIFIDGDYEGFRRWLHDQLLAHPEKLIEQDFQVCTVSLIGHYDPATGELSYADDPLPFDLEEDYKQIRAIREAATHAN